MIELKGYVIVGPVRKWDEKYCDQIIADTSFQSFGKSPHEAWMRHLGGWRPDFDRGDVSRRIQFYFDRGYRLKKAKMIIDDAETVIDEEEDNDEFAEGSEALKLLQEMTDGE